MPPRPTLPADDLYARLEISVDASPEVIEVAWRSLLRQHHPDVAGPDGLERAKRINVAHDWLSDPELRARYDRERGVRRSIRDDGGRDPRTERTAPPRAVRQRPADPQEALNRFLERVAALGPDEIDRLACADPTPIAFGATIARFLPADQLAALEAMETGGRGAARPACRGTPRRSRRGRGLCHRARPRLVPRRHAQRALSRARPRAPDPGLGGRRRTAALRPERRRGPGPHRSSRRARRGRHRRPWRPPRSGPAWTAVRPSRGRPGPRPRTTRPCACRRCWPRRMRQPRSTPTGPHRRP